MKEIIVAYDETQKERSPVMGEWVGELVRCKHCWKREFDNCPFYESMDYKPDDEWYCADGERET